MNKSIMHNIYTYTNSKESHAYTLLDSTVVYTNKDIKELIAWSRSWQPFPVKSQMAVQIL